MHRQHTQRLVPQQEQRLHGRRAVVAGIANPIGSGATSAINENLDNTTIAPVVVRYVITPSYGACTGTPFNLDVTVNPTAVITSAATATVCDNTPLGYTATSSTAGATFAWTRAVVAGIANRNRQRSHIINK